MNIKQVFDKSANEYDPSRRQLIPCFDDLYGSALNLITFPRSSEFNVLDLGAGTGLFSSFISNLYPNAKFTLYDISKMMLDKAKERFSSSNIRVDYVVKDYSREPLRGKFDLVISALSIHHLTDLEKQSLFRKVFLCLNKKGMFINADQSRGETAYIDNIYRDTWLNQVRNNGVTASTLNAAFERMKEDKMSTLSEQMEWMNDAGFSEVNCWYQNYSFVLYSGLRK